MGKYRISLALCLAIMLTCFAGAVDQPSKWAAGDVQNAIDAGLVPEELQSAYDTPITRQDFCRLAARLLPDAQGEKSVSFVDTSDPDVLRLASLGVVNGKENGRFAPDDQLTRQEAAAMLYRMAGKGTVPAARNMQLVPHVWNDRNALPLGQAGYLAPWAREAADFCYNTGVIAGVGDNCFDPQGAYTREQSMITLLRLKQWAEAGGTASKTAERRFLFRDGQTGKYGYKNAAGEIVIPAQFDVIDGYVDGFLGDFLSFEGDYAIVWQDGKCCMIDQQGNRVARDNAWDGWFYSIQRAPGNCAVVSGAEGERMSTMLSLPDGTVMRENMGVSDSSSNGYQWYYTEVGQTAEGYPDFRYVLMDSTGKQLTDFCYTRTGYFADGVVCTQREDGSLVLLDEQGRELPTKCGFDVSLYEINRSWGDLLEIQKRDFSGNYLFRFDGTQVFASSAGFNIDYFSNGYFYVSTQDERGGLMDPNGKILLPQDRYTNASEEILRGICIIDKKEGLIMNAIVRLYDTAGNKISDTDLSRGAFGDGGSVMCTSDYIHPADVGGDLGVDRGLWAVLLDETGRELSRIENAPQTKFEDGALRVVHDDGSVNYYTPSGRKLV